VSAATAALPDYAGLVAWFWVDQPFALAIHWHRQHSGSR